MCPVLKVLNISVLKFQQKIEINKSMENGPKTSKSLQCYSSDVNPDSEYGSRGIKLKGKAEFEQQK